MKKMKSAKKRLSIKLQLTIWFAALMVIVCFGAVMFSYAETSSLSEKNTEDQLVELVENRAEKVGFGRFSDKSNSHKNDKVDGSKFITAIYNNKGEVVIGRIPHQVKDFNLKFIKNQLRTAELGPSTFKIYDAKVKTTAGVVYWVRGFARVIEPDLFSSNTAVFILVLLLCTVVVAVVGGYLITKRVMKPVESIIDVAEEIASKTSADNVELSVPDSNSSDETFRLSKTINNMLDRISESLEAEKKFASDVSHEIRTPVSVILAQCDYMDNENLSKEETSEAISVIKRQANSMSELITAMLSYTRIERGTERVVFEKADFSEIVDSVCCTVSDVYSNKNITMTKDIQNECYANVDIILIYKLVENLVTNAYKYTGEGGKIAVGVKLVEENIVLTVRDNGIGIAKENLDKIFDRFYQVSEARTSGNNASSGLGLAIAKQIAEIHDGSLSVESQLGLFTEFTFIIRRL